MANVRGRQAATSIVASEEFVPPFDWTDDPNSHYLLVDLPDFKKEWLNLQVDDQGHVIVSGEGPVRNKILRFEKSFDVPQNSDIEKISGNFDGGVLCVVIPKLVIEEGKEQERGKETTDVVEGKPEHTREGEERGKEAAGVVEEKRDHAKEEKRDHAKEEEKNGQEARKGVEEKREDTKEREEIGKETAKQDEERRQGKKEEEGDGNIFQGNDVEKRCQHEEQDDHNGRRYDKERDKSSRIGDGEGNLEDSTGLGTRRQPEGGLLASVTEMLYKNKGIVMAAVLAFSLGVLVSQKFQSNVGVGIHGSLSPM